MVTDWKLQERACRGGLIEGEEALKIASSRPFSRQLQAKRSARIPTPSPPRRTQLGNDNSIIELGGSRYQIQQNLGAPALHHTRRQMDWEGGREGLTDTLSHTKFRHHRPPFQRRLVKRLHQILHAHAALTPHRVHSAAQPAPKPPTRQGGTPWLLPPPPISPRARQPP